MKDDRMERKCGCHSIKIPYWFSLYFSLCSLLYSVHFVTKCSSWMKHSRSHLMLLAGPVAKICTSVNSAWSVGSMSVDQWICLNRFLYFLLLNISCSIIYCPLFSKKLKEVILFKFLILLASHIKKRNWENIYLSLSGTFCFGYSNRRSRQLTAFRIFSSVWSANLICPWRTWVSTTWLLCDPVCQVGLSTRVN